MEIALDGENDSVRLGAFKTLGTYIGMEQAPRTNDADRTDIALIVALKTIREMMSEFQLSFNDAVREYFGYIRPDHEPLREKVTQRLLSEMGS